MNASAPRPRLARSLACLALLLAAPLAAAPAPRAVTPPAEAGATRLSLAAFEERPKLVLIVVVDQLRADTLTRFSSRFLPARGKDGAPGGYRFLMSDGAYYPFASYGLLQAMTGPGHATVLTGSYPYRNGIGLNLWCETGDTGKTRSVYCVDDAGAPLVGGSPLPGSRDTPYSCTAQDVTGISPRRLIATTVGDELKTAGLHSRVVSVALKDRAAVLLGGHHADLALWFDPQGWGWISSKYYLSDGALPQWVQGLNEGLRARRGDEVVFTNTGTPSGRTEGGEFRAAPRLGSGGALKTPYGLSITVDAALAAADAYGLGKGQDTDLLSLSFSSHDYVGHDSGPNRIELEEMAVAEDRELSRLFGALARRLPGGLDDLLVVLTADHGMSPAPGFIKGLASRGPAAADLAGYLDGDALREQADALLVKRFGPAPRGAWVNGTVDLNFWLDRPALASRGIALEEAERALQEALRTLVPTAQFVLTRSELRDRRGPAGLLGEHLARGFNQSVHGDVLLLVRPFFMPQGDADTHFTDYTYDLTVPVAIAGRRVRPGVYPRGAQVVDLAPTLSFLLGVLPPALSEGRVLDEALQEPPTAQTRGR
jgi:arylsulfatase A-like enzyme